MEKDILSNKNLKRTISLSCLGLAIIFVVIIAAVVYISRDWKESKTDNNQSPAVSTTPSPQARTLYFKNTTVKLDGSSYTSDPFWGSVIYKTGESTSEVLQQTLAGTTFYYDSQNDTFYFKEDNSLISLGLITNAEIKNSAAETSKVTETSVSKSSCKSNTTLVNGTTTSVLTCSVTSNDVSKEGAAANTFTQNNCYYYLGNNLNLVFKYDQVTPSAYDTCKFLEQHGLKAVTLISNY